MKQERLNDLAIIALENDILEKINYQDIIEDMLKIVAFFFTLILDMLLNIV